jgi:ribosomal protein S18 acetylase RimI-like enzyme
LIQIAKPRDAADHAWLTDVWNAEWGADFVISRGKIHRLEDQNALIAWQDDARLGAVTYRFDDGACEVTGVNATIRKSGIGTALLDAVVLAARDAGIRRVWLITTNDNLDALRFYQRRDFRLIAVYPGAIDESRKIKPAIPHLGEYGIPLRDELELEKWV